LDKHVKSLVEQYPDAYERIGDRKVAYHISESMIQQGLTELQNLQGEIAGGAFFGLKMIIGKIFNFTFEGGLLIIGPTIDSIIADVYSTAIDGQIEYYNERMDLGHGIVVLAHGTGNFLTQRAFDSWDNDEEKWKQNYLHVVSVGSSLLKTINDGKGILFDNDLFLNEYIFLNLYHVNNIDIYLQEYLDINLTDNQDIGEIVTFWNKYLDINLTESLKLVDHVVVKNPNRRDKIFQNATGENTVFEDIKSINYHKFEYYIGFPVNESSFVNQYKNSTETIPRQTDVAKKLIQQWVYEEIIAHGTRESHWMYDSNGSDYKVNLKHKFTGATFNAEIYPFNMLNGKVYLLDDNVTYVKALYGGTKFDANWTEQQPNEVYRLNNPEEEKILTNRFRFSGENNLTIIDTETYLLWNNTDLPWYTWGEANIACQKLTLESYENWRMPNIYELKSILNLDSNTTLTHNVYNEFFTALYDNPYGYWSSTTFSYYDQVWTGWGYYNTLVTDALVLSYINSSLTWIDTKYDMNLMCVQQL